METSVSAQWLWLGEDVHFCHVSSWWGHPCRTYALLCFVESFWYWSSLFYARPWDVENGLQSSLWDISREFNVIRSLCIERFNNQSPCRGPGSFCHMFSRIEMKPAVAHSISLWVCASHWFTDGLGMPLNMCHIGTLRLTWKLCQNFYDQIQVLSS